MVAASIAALVNVPIVKIISSLQDFQFLAKLKGADYTVLSGIDFKGLYDILSRISVNIS